MCGRFTLRTPTETIASLFDGLTMPELRPRYNIAPTQMISCIRSPRAGQPEYCELRWGLVPFWSKDLKIGAKMINARSETASEKPSFRAAFKKRRCLILADGFYEWKKVGMEKFPYYITRSDDQPFCLAGLWESWSKGESPVESATILTTSANQTMQPLHDRMPVILSPDDYDFWMDPEFDDVDQLNKRLKPCDPDLLAVREVSRTVNKVANEVPECIEPVSSLFD